jgi:uncharacterized protein YacL
MNIQNIIFASTGLSLLVVILVWFNVRDVVMPQNNRTQRLIRTFLFSIIVVSIALYFFVDSEDEIIENMIKTAPDF